MFKYAVSNWIYDNEDIEDTCGRLQRAGFDGIELVGEPERHDPAKIAAAVSGHGLRVVSVLSWCIWPLEGRDLAHADPAERSRAVSYVCHNVDLAAAVGAPVVVVIPAPSGRTAPHRAEGPADQWQEAAAEEWRWAVESVREAASHAAKKGITIAVEPINRFETFIVNSAAQGISFMEDVGMPNVKLHLDTFHMNIEDADIEGAIEMAAGHLVSMHLSDSNRCAIGRGHFDFAGLLASLVKTGFQGPLVLEPLPPHPNPFVANRLPVFRAAWEDDLIDSIGLLRRLEQEARDRKHTMGLGG